MTDGRVDRTHAGARSKDVADHLAPVQEAAARAPAFGRLGVLAAQPRLAAADGGAVELDAQVAGQPEAPRVGQAVAVDDEHLGLEPQPLPGGEEGRHLPEGEQARYVGELERANRGRDLLELEPGEGEDGDRGPGLAAADADVGAGDQGRLVERPALNDPRGEAALELDRLGRRGWERARRGPLHGPPGRSP